MVLSPLLGAVVRRTALVGVCVCTSAEHSPTQSQFPRTREISRHTITSMERAFLATSSSLACGTCVVAWIAWMIPDHFLPASEPSARRRVERLPRASEHAPEQLAVSRMADDVVSLESLTLSPNNCALEEPLDLVMNFSITRDLPAARWEIKV